MSDDDKTPKIGRIPTPPSGVRSPRVQSQEDRDARGLSRQRQERAQSQTVFVSEDLTDQYEIGAIDRETLRARRESRPPLQRVSHLEERVDGVVDSIGGVRADLTKQIGDVRADLTKQIGDVRTDMTRELGNVTSAISSLTGSVTGLATIFEDSRKREHITFKAEVDVATAEKKAEIAVDTAEKKDAIAAKGERRKTILKIVGGGGVGVALWEILKHLVERL